MTNQSDSCPVTGRALSHVSVDTRERSYVETLSRMLGDPEWLLPIVAAQPQYRRTYYPLTAAALLEDLWYDALANWMARTEPEVVLEKTQRGEPGASGDYVVEGLPYSHKSGNGPQTTGVHWDALVAQSDSGRPWTSSTAVTYVGSGYGNLTGEWVPVGSSPTARRNCRSAWTVPETVPPRGRVLALVVWRPDGTAEVLEKWDDWPDFSTVWGVLAPRVAAGIPANHLELLWVTINGGPNVGDQGSLAWSGRPGVFVFPRDLLQALPTAGNNRATTLEKATVLGLMQSTARLGLWAPMPMWFAAYALPRPPDLYLAQRGEFDRRFSPASQ